MAAKLQFLYLLILLKRKLATDHHHRLICIFIAFPYLTINTGIGTYLIGNYYSLPGSCLTCGKVQGQKLFDPLILFSGYGNFFMQINILNEIQQLNTFFHRPFEMPYGLILILKPPARLLINSGTYCQRKNHLHQRKLRLNLSTRSFPI